MAAKPPVKLRPPPAPVSLEHVNPAETFVRGKRPDVQASSRVVSRADGRELRRLTVYLPVPLARELLVHCAEQDVEVSTAIAGMIAAALHSG